MVRSHLAVFILSAGFLLLEELVQTGFGVLQRPVTVEISVEVDLLGLQRLQEDREFSVSLKDLQSFSRLSIVPPELPARLSGRSTPSGWLLGPTELLLLLLPTQSLLLLLLSSRVQSLLVPARCCPLLNSRQTQSVFLLSTLWWMFS